MPARILKRVPLNTRIFCPHLNPLPKGEEDAKRQVRVAAFVWRGTFLLRF
jgi:hypothetical protein